MGWVSTNKKVLAEIAVLLLIFGYSALYYLEVASLPSREINLLLIQPVFFVIGLSTVALIIAKVRQALRSSAVISPETAATASDPLEAEFAKSQISAVDPKFIKNGIIFAVCTVTFVLLLDRLGFVASSILYLCVLIYLLGSRSFWLTIVLPVVVVAFLYVTMAILLKFSLPQGLFI